MSIDLVKMSPKGQLVVPQGIREGEGLNAGDRFISIAVEDGVIFKKVDFSDLKKEFEKLSKDVQKQFKAKGIGKEEVSEAIKWARK